MELSVGQELWFVHRERRSGAPHAVVVTKVGRKWAQLDRGGYRIDVNTLAADGGNYTSPGRCWINRETWEAEEVRQDAWSNLRSYFDHRWTAPAGISTAQIREILAALPHEQKR